MTPGTARRPSWTRLDVTLSRKKEDSSGSGGGGGGGGSGGDRHAGRLTLDRIVCFQGRLPGTAPFRASGCRSGIDARRLREQQAETNPGERRQSATRVFTSGGGGGGEADQTTRWTKHATRKPNIAMNILLIVPGTMYDLYFEKGGLGQPARPPAGNDSLLPAKLNQEAKTTSIR